MTRKWLHYKHDYPDGRSSFDKEYKKLPADVRAGYDELKERVTSGEARSGEIKNIGDGIYELKLRVGNDQYRLLYIEWRTYYVALTVLLKKKSKTSKDLALRRQKRWNELSKNWA